MSDYAIKVEGLSKVYSMGAPVHSNRYSPLILARQAKRYLMRQPLLDLNKQDGLNKGEFLALDDVSFEVKHGERVGIIGRNGAGKSTLLKILSRITKPTKGYVDVYGKLGALLEVGTGFHPELSGRENIFLNAAILGLTKKDVQARFDEIVAFAEVEDFLDMPVKHYSSGMFMRLAFSVSAHLDPDILVLDEVLAVGDAAFQKKCLGKMEGVAKDGRTVLFVSHSVASIVSFCDRCILLDHGRLIRDGSAMNVTEYYQESLTTKSNRTPEALAAEKNKSSKAVFTTINVTPLGFDGEPCSTLRVGQDVEIEATIVAYERITENNVAIVISDSNGFRVIDANIALKNDFLSLKAGEQAIVRFTLHNVLLRPATYRIGLWAGRRAVEDTDIVLDAATFDVEVDPKRILHFQIFDGVYQCEFTHSIKVQAAI